MRKVPQKLPTIQAAADRSRSIEALRRMTPEARLAKAFALTALVRALMLEGIRVRHPGASEEQVRRLGAAQWARCHNRNY